MILETFSPELFPNQRNYLNHHRVNWPPIRYTQISPLGTGIGYFAFSLHTSSGFVRRRCRLS